MSFHNAKWTFALGMGFIVLMLLIPSALALPAFQEELPCEGDPECYQPPEETIVPEPPPPPPEQTAVPDSGVSASVSSWNGYGDGRLNPQMDEYYSVYCKAGSLEVRGISATNTQEISRIPIHYLIEGPFPFDGGNGLTVNRSEDSITISGSNGYGPQHPGSKSFSLVECIERNGIELSVEITLEAAPIEGVVGNSNGIPPDCKLLRNAQLPECEDYHQTCESAYYASQHVSECTPSLLLLSEMLGLKGCFTFLTSSMPVGLVIAFRFRRKRK